MARMKLMATIDSFDEVNRFVEEALILENCPPQITMQILLAVEEIYVNVAHYAYAPSIGEVTIDLQISEVQHTVMIEFQDTGIPFNPLAKEDADITQGAEERPIGGLGILLTKKLMDKVEYEYKEGKNVLKITKQM